MKQKYTPLFFFDGKKQKYTPPLMHYNAGFNRKLKENWF